MEPGLTLARLITLQRPLLAKQSRAGETIPRVKMTMFWFKALPMTKILWATLDLPIMLKIKIIGKSKVAQRIFVIGKGGILPSQKTVEDGTYEPLSRPIFIYINNKSLDRKEVKEFVEFYLKNAAKLVQEVKYIPLPAKAYEMVLGNFQKGKIGTVFGGKSEVKLKIETLLQREAKY